MTEPLVGIIMGSSSDWETMRHAADLLDQLGITHETRIVSAHRTPERLYEYARSAKERGLNYIGLDGEVGIIGNGAGLVMSTLDVVNQAGGKAANFLDVGGGAGAKTISNALEVITSDPNVRSVLINIF